MNCLVLQVHQVVLGLRQHAFLHCVEPMLLWPWGVWKLVGMSRRLYWRSFHPLKSISWSWISVQWHQSGSLHQTMLCRVFPWICSCKKFIQLTDYTWCCYITFAWINDKGAWWNHHTWKILYYGFIPFCIMFYLPLLIVALLFALAVDKDHFFSCLFLVDRSPL